MRLESLTRPELIDCHLAAADRDAVLRTFAERLAEQGLVPEADDLFEKLAEREQLGSTGIGSGVAIPHCKLKGLSRPVLSIGRVEGAGIDFGAVDGKPVRLFFLVVSPNDSPAEHLQVLAAISRWIKTNDNVEAMLEADDPQEVYRQLREENA